MIVTNFNGTDFYLLDAHPNWDIELPKTDISVVSITEAGLTNREGRRAFAASLRWDMRFTATTWGTAARRLEGALREYQTQPVAVPLWLLMTGWSTRSACAITGGLKLVWKSDWSQFELFTDTEPSWPTADDNFAPVLVGRLKDTKGEWEDTDFFNFAVDFEESSPIEFATTAQVITFPAGPLPPSGYVAAPRLLPLNLGWEEYRRSTRVEVITDKLSFRRQTIETAYPQTNADEREQTHFILPEDLPTYLAFFAQHASGYPFWHPTWLVAAEMTSAIGAGVTVLPVVDTYAVKAGDWLACIDAEGTLVAAPRISSKTGTSITLATAPGALAANTMLTRMQLLRFLSPKITLSWHQPGLATVKFAAKEVPPEYVPPGDETVGTTIGLLPTRGYTYDLVRVVDGVTLTTRYTSYERDLTLSGNSYTSFDIGHGDIKQTLNLQPDSVEINSLIAAGNPLVEAARLTLEVPIHITVRQVDVTGSTAFNPVVLFTGTIKKAGVRGRKIRAIGGFGKKFIDQQYPRSLIGPSCRYCLFSAGCTLAAADWEFTAKVVGPVSAAWPFALDLEDLARTIGGVPTFFTDWFAGGIIQIGTGADTQQRVITASTNPVSDALTINVRNWFTTSPAIGAAVKLWPGCDLQNTTCKAYHATDNPTGKFNNYVNFGGEDKVPVGNPSLIKLSNAVAGGKK